MNPRIVTLTLLATALLLARPANAEQAPYRPRVALWAQPVGALIVTSIGAINGSPLIVIPLGLNVSVLPWMDLVVEATFGWQTVADTSIYAIGGILSLGLAFRPFSSEPLRGFFLQPKIAAWYLVQGGYNIAYRDVRLEVGLDLGYQWVIGRLFIAPVVGASWVAWQTSESGGAPPYGVNLNLLRVGVAL